MKKLGCALTSALALLGVRSAQAANVALLGDGATFVSASSFDNLGGSVEETNPINPNPQVYLGNGETRYIFGGGDPSEYYEIRLGGSYLISDFSTTFGTIDRTVTGPFTVQTSLDGSAFTPVLGTNGAVVDSGETTDTLTATAPTLAEYVVYDFGPAPSAGEGSGILSVTADAAGPAVSAAPEPSTWALLMLGIGGIGLMLRRPRKPALSHRRDCTVS